jgi:hypothetical protein
MTRRIIIFSLLAVACDGDAKATKSDPAPIAEKTATKVADPEKPTPPELPPPPAITVCDGQQEKSITSMKALTACVTAAADASGVADASATLAKLAADTHACTDKGCSEKLTQAMTSYATELASKREKEAGKGACESEADELQHANAKLLECTQAAMGGNDVDEAITKMTGFADEMCACKDKLCADIVMASMTKYGETMARKYEGKPQPDISDAQKQRMEDPMKRLTECSVKAMGG